MNLYSALHAATSTFLICLLNSLQNAVQFLFMSFSLNWLLVLSAWFILLQIHWYLMNIWLVDFENMLWIKLINGICLLLLSIIFCIHGLRVSKDEALTFFKWWQIMLYLQSHKQILKTKTHKFPGGASPGQFVPRVVQESPMILFCQCRDNRKHGRYALFWSQWCLNQRRQKHQGDIISHYHLTDNIRASMREYNGALAAYEKMVLTANIQLLD